MFTNRQLSFGEKVECHIISAIVPMYTSQCLHLVFPTFWKELFRSHINATCSSSDIKTSEHVYVLLYFFLQPCFWVVKKMNTKEKVFMQSCYTTGNAFTQLWCWAIQLMSATILDIVVSLKGFCRPIHFYENFGLVQKTLCNIVDAAVYV